LDISSAETIGRFTKSSAASKENIRIHLPFVAIIFFYFLFFDFIFFDFLLGYHTPQLCCDVLFQARLKNLNSLNTPQLAAIGIFYFL